ncbi:unnamed protein product, partial [Mesorhabditis spiculigera]
MLRVCSILLLLLGIINAQPPPGGFPAGEVNVDKIGQMYGIATQLMSLTNEFMGNGRGGGGGGGSAGSYRESGYGGNSILSEVANNMRSGADEKLTLYNEYGGLPSGGRPRSGIQSILNTFLGSSVSGDSEPLPPPPPPRQPARPRQNGATLLDLFGLGTTEAPTTTTTEAPAPAPGRNILEMFGLVRPTPPPVTTTTRRTLLDLFAAAAPAGYGMQGMQGMPGIPGFYSPPSAPYLPAQPPQPQQAAPAAASASYGYDRYGRAPPAGLVQQQPQGVQPLQDPLTPRSRGQRSIIDAFLGGAPAQEQKPQQRAAPIVDMLEMFGLMEKTTTTQRPRLFDSRSGFGMGSKGASDIDAILNALMRGGAKTAEPEPPSPAGMLSQFFGKK